LPGARAWSTPTADHRPVPNHSIQPEDVVSNAGSSMQQVHAALRESVAAYENWRLTALPAPRTLANARLL
jgi:hypothetical protein